MLVYELVYVWPLCFYFDRKSTLPVAALLSDILAVRNNPLPFPNHQHPKETLRKFPINKITKQAFTDMTNLIVNRFLLGQYFFILRAQEFKGKVVDLQSILLKFQTFCMAFRIHCK